MTDRIHSLVVVLEEDVRDDEIQPLISAIKHMRNVLSVEGNISDYTAYMAQERARSILRDKASNALRELVR